MEVKHFFAALLLQILVPRRAVRGPWTALRVTGCAGYNAKILMTQCATTFTSNSATTPLGKMMLGTLGYSIKSEITLRRLSFPSQLTSPSYISHKERAWLTWQQRHAIELATPGKSIAPSSRSACLTAEWHSLL